MVTHKLKIHLILTAGATVLSAVFAAQAASDVAPTYVVSKAHKAYHLVPSCKIEENVVGCQKTPPADDPEREFEDFTMYLGDESPLPGRGFLPWKESELEIEAAGMLFRFRGPMIVCIDLDVKNRKIRAKFFQSRPEVTVEQRNGRTEITAVSNHDRGLAETSVGVLEGEVAVTTPWFCESCDETKTYLVGPGECYQFRYRPQEPGTETPKVQMEKPKQMDSTR